MFPQPNGPPCLKKRTDGDSYMTTAGARRKGPDEPCAAMLRQYLRAAFGPCAQLPLEEAKWALYSSAPFIRLSGP